MTERRSPRIIVCGDPGTGKSSLIFSLVGRTFGDSMPRVIQALSYPSLLHTGRYLEIHDSSSVPRALLENGHTTEWIKNADVVLLVTAPFGTSLRRAHEFWIPHIDSLAPNAQIVVVMNKTDLLLEAHESILEGFGHGHRYAHDHERRQNDNPSSSSSSPPSEVVGENPSLRWESEHFAIVKTHPRVERLIEVSAKTGEGIPKTFSMAEYVMMYPTAPLYDRERRSLTHRAKRALTVMFRQYDEENSGTLDDDAIRRFQRECFNSNLDAQQIHNIKATLLSHNPENIAFDSTPTPTPTSADADARSAGRATANRRRRRRKSGADGGGDADADRSRNQNGGITLRGFLSLHLYIAQRNRMHTAWSSLRQHNFNDSLLLNPSCEPVSHPRLPHYLSRAQRAFLRSLFTRHCKTYEGMLTAMEFGELVSVLETNPFRNATYRVPRSEDGSMTLDVWLSAWTMFAWYQPAVTNECLRYFGLSDAEAALLERTTSTPGRVVQCSIFGAANVGKQHLLAALSDDCFSQHSSEGEVFAGFRACRTIDPHACPTTSKDLSLSSREACYPTTPSSIPHDGRITPLHELEVGTDSTSLATEGYFSNVRLSTPNYSETSRGDKDTRRAVSLILEEVSGTNDVVADKWEACDLPLLLYDRSDMESVRYMRRLLKAARKPVVLVSMNNDGARTLLKLHGVARTEQYHRKLCELIRRAESHPRCVDSIEFSSHPSHAADVFRRFVRLIGEHSLPSLDLSPSGERQKHDGTSTGTGGGGFASQSLFGGFASAWFAGATKHPASGSSPDNIDGAHHSSTPEDATPSQAQAASLMLRKRGVVAAACIVGLTAAAAAVGAIYTQRYSNDDGVHSLPQSGVRRGSGTPTSASGIISNAGTLRPSSNSAHSPVGPSAEAASSMASGQAHAGRRMSSFRVSTAA